MKRIALAMALGGSLLASAPAWAVTFYDVAVRSSGSDVGSFEEIRTRARYLSTPNGGGSDAYFNSVTTPGFYTKFSLVDLNEGALMSGDQVHLQTNSGHFFVAELGGGDVVKANRTQAREWETFTILRLSGTTVVGGAIQSGDAVALRAYDGRHYVQAEYGGVQADGSGGGMNARAVAIGAWERLILYLSPVVPVSPPSSGLQAEPYFKLQFTHPKYNTNGPSSSANCGPASLAMVLKMLGYEPVSKSTETTIEHARYLMFPSDPRVTTKEGLSVLPANGEGTSNVDIARGMQSAGGNAGYYEGWDVLDRKLGEGKPVIAYGYLDDNWRGQFPGSVGNGNVGHINAILGKSPDGGYVVADPMHRGGPVVMTRDQLKVFFRKESDGSWRSPSRYELPTFTAVTFANNSAFVSATVPMHLKPGQPYWVTVRMKNMAPANSSPTWTSAAGFKLGSQGPQDNTTWGLGRVMLPRDVPAQGQVDFGFWISAPGTPGTYSFQWRMVQEGVRWFGPTSRDLPIVVGW